jgi:hypothetical protein
MLLEEGQSLPLLVGKATAGAEMVLLVDESIDLGVQLAIGRHAFILYPHLGLRT